MIAMSNAHIAEASETNISGYVLNAAHPDGASKAAIVQMHEFRRASWHLLDDALAEIATTAFVRAVSTTE